MKWTRHLLPLALILILTACGFMQQRGSWDPFGGSVERQISIRIQNQGFDDVIVDVVAGGRRERLGTVPGRTTQQHTLSWSQSDDLRFRLEPLIGRPHTVSAGVVLPGARVNLYVEDPLTRSFVSR